MPDTNGNGHTHPHSHDHDHDHEHEHPHGHSHAHTHTETKAVLNRLSRAIGHLESVRRMVEDGRDCAEVLIQLAAVRSALGNTAKIILKDHIEHCLVEAVRDNDRESIDELNKAIEQFLK
jgi:DNA-binding FrmR family transcriptional regulator